MTRTHDETLVLDRVDEMRDEMLAVAGDFLRIPTTNPPGTAYPEAASFLDDLLESFDYETEILIAEGAAAHTAEHPRHNVFASRASGTVGPCLHLNGHTDVVPPGDGWTVDPWSGEVRDGKIWGRGSADMKCGLVSAIFAAEAVARAGASTRGTIEVSGTADEESGGFAGVAWLARQGRISATRTNWVIIPEPFGPERICVGHRGVLWLKITAHGRIAHGSMPFLGVSAIEGVGPLIEQLTRDLQPLLATRETQMPVVPPEARRATLNLNSVYGGQGNHDPQTPCVADRCELVLDRRYLWEEDLGQVRGEIRELVESLDIAGTTFEIEDLMVVPPVRTPTDSPLITSLERSIASVTERPAERVASPGTYDHKHVARIAGVDHCVAYGPGKLELAHQPDEYCSVDDMLTTTRVMALSILDLLGTD